MHLTTKIKNKNKVRNRKCFIVWQGEKLGEDSKKRRKRVIKI